jgi:hypothetical protein
MSQAINGIPFEINAESDLSHALPDQTSNVNKQHIPIGDNNVIDLGGRNLPTLSIPAFFLTEAAYGNAVALVGQLVNLAYVGNTYFGVLESITGTKYYEQVTLFDGSAVLIEATLAFSLTL